MNIKILASSSNGNCFTVDDGKTKLMIEVGLSYKEIQKALDFKVSSVDGLLCSHEHGDHSRGIKDLLKAGIDCYLTGPTADALGISGHRVNRIEPLKQFVINSFEILPFPTIHDAASPVGFLIKSKVTGSKLVFITDSAYCKYVFSEVTHFMIEINFCDDILDQYIFAEDDPEKKEMLRMRKSRLIRSHFSLKNAIEFFEANDLSKVQEIHILHLSDGNSDEQRIKTTIQSVTGKPVFIAKR